MADPTKISVVIDVPILVQILEAVRTLGAQSEDFSVRLQAIEARPTVAPTADGASIEPDDRSPYHHAGDDGHITPAQAQFSQPTFAPYQTSSIPKHVSARYPRPRSGRPADRSALGKKRKRADSPGLDQAGGTAPGFQMRDSTTQIEENRRETLARSREATPIAEEPSRSESPFDNRDAEFTSDGLESMPPLRPQQAASMPPPRARSRRHQSPRDSQPGESVLKADELSNISQSGRVRKQTPRQTGFVGLPTKKEINRDSRLTKRGGQR
ncbi:hypothetical protein D6D12_03982 [Aureobasidium pullulans]|uniref:Shugoshin C-terminal domain-containing protein n=1 Tax=Aureobasidium pullulans TaxID=5580 RepID=A0AB74JYB1_AURPU|nr:hypothetical protein D6D12_03982 [Aureobasidium pullulans]THX46617.1 hypothetical protein D6D11_06781 [Aureobasidium pullulans]